MSQVLYAVVSYVSGELGSLVNQMRSELAPEQARLRAHITLLPPCPLAGSVESAVQTLEKLSRQLKPVEVCFGDVGLFVPITPTVYLSIDKGAAQVRAAHAALNVAEFLCDELLPYVPHLTIAALPTDQEAERAAQIARRRWVEYKGPRCTAISELTFAVERDLSLFWDDIAGFRLQG